MQYFSQDHVGYLIDTTGLDASHSAASLRLCTNCINSNFYLDGPISPESPGPKVREFSVEVFKKVEKCKDEFLKSDDTERTSREEEDGKELETENGYGESVDACVVKEGSQEVDTKVQVGMYEFVKATDEGKGKTEVETEVKEEDQDQESKAKASSPKLPRCNEGGKEEVATKGEAVIGNGNDEGAEVSQDNDHCQEAEKMEADVIEKVLKAMEMSVNKEEADSDEIDKICPTNQAEKAEGILMVGKAETEKEQEAKRVGGGKEIIKVSGKALDEGNKDNTDELEGVKGDDQKKEVGQNEKFKVAEKEETATMKIPIKATQLTEKEENKENTNGTYEVKEVKLSEETGGDLEKKELKEKNNGVETKGVVAASIETMKKVESEVKFTKRDDTEIKSDKTTRAQPKEEVQEGNGENEVSGDCKEIDAFEINNKEKGKGSSIGVFYTKTVESDWEEEEPKEEESEIVIGHGHEDVEVKEEASANGKKMKMKKGEIIGEAQSQEVEPGEEKAVDIEADEMPGFELKKEEEVEEAKSQEQAVEMESEKDVGSQNGANEVMCMNKGIIKQQECKRNKSTEEFMLSEEAQIVELVVNATEEVEAKPNGDFV
ncbi:hypothetical protein TSMEX_011825 [Taenia solium]|eukprot:TsM_001013400 transcript=TsM_001013400 gene=TsM_001013400